MALPYSFLRRPEETADLMGPGHTVHLHATDADVELTIDLTGPTPIVRDGHEKAAVTVRGLVMELVLALYRRREPDGLKVSGDAALLKEFLGRARF